MQNYVDRRTNRLQMKLTWTARNISFFPPSDVSHFSQIQYKLAHHHCGKNSLPLTPKYCADKCLTSGLQGGKKTLIQSSVEALDDFCCKYSHCG